MNNTFFNTVHINNFKSLKDVTLSDCKRINLLIGKPNVGKSNILEAIGLCSLPYFKYNNNKKLSLFIRLENLTELFFDGNNENSISIETDTGESCSIEYGDSSQNRFENCLSFHIRGENNNLFDNSNFLIELEADNQLNLSRSENMYLSPKVKYYKFTHDISCEKQDEQTHSVSYLIPPVGVNLINTIQNNRALKKELIKLFAEYHLKLLFDKGTNSLRIMKETKDGEIFSLPHKSIADTLQRLIFFKAAIASNKESILLFEEPEAHCFPPYIAHFTQDVINSTSNQFFIATHSPYVLNDFLEYQRDDVAIFMADFQDGQTIINRLTDEEVNEVYDYGIDVFFNYERFTKHG